MNARALAAFALATTSGCTLAYSDEVFGSKTPKQCSDTAECQSFVSGTQKELVACENAQCVLVECTKNEHCSDGEWCNLETHTCGEPPAARPCERDDDCNVAGGELCSPKDNLCYSKWGCLADPVDWSTGRKSSFVYTTNVRTLGRPDDPSWLTNIRARACLTTDPACEAPAVTPEDTTVDEEGSIQVPFSGVGANGWTGTIRVESELSQPVEGRSMLEGFIQFTPLNPLVTDLRQQARSLLIDTDTAKTFAQLAGTNSIIDLANVVFFFYDCGGNPAANIELGVNGANKSRAITLITEKDPDVGATVTSPFGAIFLANAPKGFAKFSLTDVGLDNKVVTDSLTFNVFPGINYMYYYPRYSALKKWIDYDNGSQSVE